MQGWSGQPFLDVGVAVHVHDLDAELHQHIGGPGHMAACHFPLQPPAEDVAPVASASA